MSASVTITCCEYGIHFLGQALKRGNQSAVFAVFAVLVGNLQQRISGSWPKSWSFDGLAKEKNRETPAVFLFLATIRRLRRPCYREETASYLSKDDIRVDCDDTIKARILSIR